MQGDKFNPNLFEIFINDLPIISKSYPYLIWLLVLYRWNRVYNSLQRCISAFLSVILFKLGFLVFYTFFYHCFDNLKLVLRVQFYMKKYIIKYLCPNHLRHIKLILIQHGFLYFFFYHGLDIQMIWKLLKWFESYCVAKLLVTFEFRSDWSTDDKNINLKGLVILNRFVF